MVSLFGAATICEHLSTHKTPQVQAKGLGDPSGPRNSGWWLRGAGACVKSCPQLTRLQLLARSMNHCKSISPHQQIFGESH